MGRDLFSAVKRGVAVAICVWVAAGSASARQTVPPPDAEIPHTQPSVNESQRLLLVHNSERARLGLPPLVWSASLARGAGNWARVLLARRSLQHSSASERNNSGENLWMGTAGAWKPTAMVDMFLDERRYFRPATFPDVSSTGSWTDVGHYSQIVWRETREVGCAVDSGNGMDVLVCRYNPAGNVVGKAPY